MDNIKCCFCGAEIPDRESCNPAPLFKGDNNRCCHNCDNYIVIPFRMGIIDVYNLKDYRDWLTIQTGLRKRFEKRNKTVCDGE